ncbi:MAG: amino acid ABC transporter substrate-binding protein [Oscillospiraceae bacterium]|jgi:polar amino acid transport system substrate-binding protein|nr:amino acid ABC transporter substrate-binding protein [Oscillospiraceae bacterium]
MKRILSLLLVLACALALFAACTPAGENNSSGNASGNSDAGTDEDIYKDEDPNAVPDRSADRSKLILGLDASFPPMGYKDDAGNIVGFDIDVAREVCKRLNWELVLQPIDWDAKDLELESGNIDCIWNGMTVNTDRIASMTLSFAYMNNEQVVLTLRSADLYDLDDFAGKKLAYQSGSSAEDALDDNPDFKASLAEVITHGDNLTAIMEVEQGSVDGLLLDSIVAKDYIKNNDPDGKTWKIIDESLAKEEYAVGFRKGDIALAMRVDAILVEMKTDGKLGEISTDWFGEDITTVIPK